MGFLHHSTLLSRSYRGRRRRRLVWGALVVTSSQPYHVQAFNAHGLSLLRPIHNHSIRKSSFVSLTQQQQQRNDRDESWSVHETNGLWSSQEILQLARKNAKRIKGSRAYTSSWRHWMEHTTRAIRQELMLSLPYPANVDELAKLSVELGIAADQGEMPSFSHPGARSGYALEYFCRARLLAGLVMQSNVGDDISSLWIQDPKRTIHLTSLGGGPGFDFVALAMAMLFSQYPSDHSPTQSCPSLNATILDYEVGWSNLVQAMNDATRKLLQQPNFHCQWGGKCDITQPLSHPSNQACLAAIATTDIWTCQYCVAENAQQLRASNYIFFHDLWNAMPDQSMMILTETTPRLWPELYHVLQESFGSETNNMQVVFPNHKGPQMFLRKCSTLSSSSMESKTWLSDDDVMLLKEFQEISAKHQERQQSGWTRQVKQQYKNLVS